MLEDWEFGRGARSVLLAVGQEGLGGHGDAPVDVHGGEAPAHVVLSTVGQLEVGRMNSLGQGDQVGTALQSLGLGRQFHLSVRGGESFELELDGRLSGPTDASQEHMSAQNHELLVEAGAVREHQITI